MENTEFVEDRRELIADEITYARTVEAKLGIHEATGLMMTEYQDIRVSPSDNVLFDPDEHDLRDPDQRAWWADWCNITGEYMALCAEHTMDELDAIAVKAGYADLEDVEIKMGNAVDDDVVLSIQREMVEVAK